MVASLSTTSFTFWLWTAPPLIESYTCRYLCLIRNTTSNQWNFSLTLTGIITSSILSQAMSTSSLNSLMHCPTSWSGAMHLMSQSECLCCFSMLSIHVINQQSIVLYEVNVWEYCLLAKIIHNCINMLLQTKKHK